MPQAAHPGETSPHLVLKPEDQIEHADEEHTKLGLPKVASLTRAAQRRADEEAARLNRLAGYDNYVSCEWWPPN
jgi:hypothetical protein